MLLVGMGLVCRRCVLVRRAFAPFEALLPIPIPLSSLIVHSCCGVLLVGSAPAAMLLVLMDVRLGGAVAANNNKRNGPIAKGRRGAIERGAIVVVVV